jgi:methyl-accepting chemotaxis protein
MKIKVKLGIMVIAIIVAVAGSIAMLQLRQATSMSLNSNRAIVRNLATSRAEMWKGKLNAYLEAVRTVAVIMSEYEDIPAEELRDRFDDVLLAVLKSQPDFVRIFSIWKPNALDGMDSRYTGRTGSTSTGQYAMTFGRDTGQIIATPNVNIIETMEHLNGPNAHKDRVQAPAPFVVNGKDTFIMRIGVPVINPRTNEAVGVVTCLFNTGSIQPMLENVLKYFTEVSAVSIYFNNGFILASSWPDRIGKMLIDV